MSDYKYALKNVNFRVDEVLARDSQATIEIKGNSLAELKANGQALAEEIAAEFDTSISNIKVEGADLSKKRFLVF